MDDIVNKSELEMFTNDEGEFILDYYFNSIVEFAEIIKVENNQRTSHVIKEFPISGDDIELFERNIDEAKDGFYEKFNVRG